MYPLFAPPIASVTDKSHCNNNTDDSGDNYDDECTTEIHCRPSKVLESDAGSIATPAISIALATDLNLWGTQCRTTSATWSEKRVLTSTHAGHVRKA